MCRCALAFILVFVPSALAVDDAKVLTTDEAAKQVDKKCTVQMDVKSTGKSGELTFLNSNENFRDDKNFTIVIDKDAIEKLKKAKIDDPIAHFKGKTIQVTGTVTLYNKKPQIKVQDAEQIKIVEKK